jgi:hypothetical protein
MSISQSIGWLGMTLAIANLALIFALNGIRKDLQRIAGALEAKK